MPVTQTAPPSVTVPLPDPEIFLGVEDLELAGRGLADAVWNGSHQSVRTGEGVEFHSHRAYQPGDDLRRVNWALYARQRKIYTKQSRQESRRPVYLLADASASMSVKHGPWEKWRYASRAIAGMAHLARRQGDAPSLGIFTGNTLGVSLPPRNSADHVTGICAALAGTIPAGEGNVAACLPMTQALCRQRGFVILLSDFFDREELILNELASYRAQGHDVLAMQVLDPLEIEIPKTGDFDFVDPETGRRVRTSVEPLHAAYARRVAAWRSSLEKLAASRGIRWMSASTADPLVPVLRRWLEAW